MSEYKILLNTRGKTIFEDKHGKILINDQDNLAAVLLAKERDTNAFILIKQYRRAIDDFVIQLPGGGVNKGENLVDAVKREFLEETGYECGQVEYLGHLATASWISNVITHVFYTEEIINFTEQKLENHENIEVIKINVDKCLELIQQQKINDSELSYAILQLILKGYVKIS